jgi:hypothetical protein
VPDENTSGYCQARARLDLDQLKEYSFLFFNSPAIMLYTLEWKTPEGQLWLHITENLIKKNQGTTLTSPDPETIVLLKEKNDKIVETI